MFKPIAKSAELEELISSAQRFFVLKHSNRCPVSHAIHQRVREHIEASGHEVHVVDVIASKPLAQEIARRFGVRHESPQLLVLEGERVVAHASHEGVDADFLREHL